MCYRKVMSLASSICGHPLQLVTISCGPMPSTVSSELISIIIDSLHSDKHALVQCSRVSTAFYGAAQIQLYASISLSSGYAGPLNSIPHIRCRRLLRTLSDSRRLTSYIDELHVLNGAWTLAEPSFPRLLVLIAARGALKVFRYGYRYPFVYQTSWREFNFLLQSALYAIFKCPSLHSLSLEGILLSTFPNDLLATITQLRHLAMRAPVSWSMTSNNIHSEMPFVQVPFNSSQNNSQLTFLESLAFYADGANILGYLTKPRCPLKLSRLRKLEIGKILWDTTTLIPWLFDQVAQTLEDLHWVKPRTDSPIYGTFYWLSRRMPFTDTHISISSVYDRPQSVIERTFLGIYCYAHRNRGFHSIPQRLGLSTKCWTNHRFPCARAASFQLGPRQTISLDWTTRCHIV